MMPRIKGQILYALADIEAPSRDVKREIMAAEVLAALARHLRVEAQADVAS